MPEKSTTGRKAGSPLRRLRTVERLLVVGAVAAVLVAVGAWIAMARTGTGAEAAGAESSVGASGGSSTTDGGTGTVELPDPTADGSEAAPTASTDGDAATTGTGTSAASGAAATGQAGTGTTAGAGSPTAGSSSGSAPLSPTKAFLTALTDSGLAPPVDDTQKLAMADDVCQEMGYGSTYADVVRALTFSGASDAEAANFARLAITTICPQYKAG